MPRSRHVRRRRHAFLPADWVYRDNVFDEAGALVNAGASYSNTEVSIAAGAPATRVQILYDSHNYMKQGVQLAAGAMVPFGSQGRAEGGRATILGYEGMVAMRPSTWAAGSAIRLGFRVGVWEQDADLGLVLVDPVYSMWGNFANTALNASAWANNREWVEERRIYKTFASANDQALFCTYFRRRCRRRLRPHKCFAIWGEVNNAAGTVGGVTTLCTYWLRTLVSDEG